MRKLLTDKILLASVAALYPLHIYQFIFFPLYSNSDCFSGISHTVFFLHPVPSFFILVLMGMEILLPLFRKEGKISKQDDKSIGTKSNLNFGSLTSHPEKKFSFCVPAG